MRGVRRQSSRFAIRFVRTIAATLGETRANLEKHALAVKQRVSPDRPLGVGLWLSAKAAEELLLNHGEGEFGQWLAERGLVRAERGSGTFVEATRLAYPIGTRTRFSEIVGATGRAVGGRLIASSTERAEGDIARRLKLKPGALVVRIELLRHADGVPLSAATSWLPGDGQWRCRPTSRSRQMSFVCFKPPRTNWALCLLWSTTRAFSNARCAPTPWTRRA